MNAVDVMTANVITVSPETSVPDLVDVLLTRNISGVPVVDGNGVLVGVVTEGDLVRRAELGTDRKHTGLLAFFTGTATMARDYVRSHATKVSDIMTPDVIAVAPATPLSEVADTMEKYRVRRVPVVEGTKVVGIVSRANLLRAWASLPADAPATTADDTAIRAALLLELGRQSWSHRPENSVVVSDGIVHLWGLAATDEEKRALELAAEATPGVRAVHDHMIVLSVEPYPLILGT